MFGKAARIASGMDERLEVIRKRKSDELQLELARATAAPSGSGATLAVPGAAPAPAVKRVKLATVADQANDLEVPELGQAEVVAAYARFEATTGGPPSSSEELTTDQLTSLHALLQGTGPPYVDFAVWGPFGHRIAKKMKLSGLVIGAKGELRQTECYGPASYHDWEQSFRVWRTGCLMLNAISSATLDQYRDLIYRYVTRYGAPVWLILYQADVRARLESMERMRRKGQKLHMLGTQIGERVFDPARPWDWSLREVVEDHSFWRRELEEPAMLVLSNSGRLSQMVEGDAPVAAPRSQSMQAASSSRGSAPPRAQHKDTRKPKHTHQHVVDSDGRMAANRSGTRLCGAFQAGQCSEMNAGMCAKDGQKTHQCAKCLSPGHGADACNGHAAREPRRGGKGSKGSGKDNGKSNGRRSQY
jgi:hypothetical protein